MTYLKHIETPKTSSIPLVTDDTMTFEEQQMTKEAEEDL